MVALRKFVTSTVAFTFVVVGTTGVIFRLWFKNHTLEEIHGWVGIWLVAAALFHVFQNWRSLVKHLRNPRVYVMLVPVLVIVAAFALQKDEPRGPNPRRVLHQLEVGHASDVARAFGKDVDGVYAAMKHDGLQAGAPTDTIEQLAERNHQPVEKILGYFAM